MTWANGQGQVSGGINLHLNINVLNNQKHIDPLKQSRIDVLGNLTMYYRIIRNRLIMRLHHL